MGAYVKIKSLEKKINTLGKLQLVGIGVGSMGIALPYILDSSYNTKSISDLSLLHLGFAALFSWSIMRLGITRPNKPVDLMHQMINDAEESIYLYSDDLNYGVYGQGEPAIIELLLEKSEKMPVRILTKYDSAPKTIYHVLKNLHGMDETDRGILGFDLRQLRDPKLADRDSHFLVVDENQLYRFSRDEKNGVSINPSIYAYRICIDYFNHLASNANIFALSR